MASRRGSAVSFSHPSARTLTAKQGGPAQGEQRLDQDVLEGVAREDGAVVVNEGGAEGDAWCARDRVSYPSLLQRDSPAHLRWRKGP